MTARVDLNCDMGEGFGAWPMGHDAAVLPFVSSVNVACGFHAGDAAVMRRTVAAALDHGVAIGAHPGLPDLAGFGRRAMAITPQDAYDMVVYQLGALVAIAACQSATVQHVKPHGALYNMAATQPPLADAIARAVHDVNPALRLMGLSGSALIDAARAHGLGTISEVFADRHYLADGTLVPRSSPQALVHDAAAAADRAVAMVLSGTVVAIDGSAVPLTAESICIHGDADGAPVFAERIRAALSAAGITVAAPRAISPPS